MSRVWSYIIPKTLSARELEQLKNDGEKFTKEWTAHDQQLSATFDIIEERVILVKVNEQVHGASGCSIDKLTRFIKQESEQLGADLLDRFQIAYESKEKVEVTNAKNIPELLSSGTVSADTLVYDTTIFSDEQLKEFKKPLRNTWLKKFLVT